MWMAVWRWLEEVVEDEEVPEDEYEVEQGEDFILFP